MEAYGPGLRRYFRRRIADGDVDDLVQEVFLRLHSRYMNGSIENLEGYLFRTAHNVLVSRYREQASRIVSSSDKWAEGLSAYDPISPERITIGQEEYRRVIAAIQNLPPRTREAFELHRFENLTYQAIAQRMGISRNSVKDLMHRALLHITEAVEAGQ
ncbi:RNA polymerase sigma factor [Sandaracinobacteroides sayramensis]|uniref:RNA polymerase sigma factor n=1 Tax=Sandaracinobacteroides sayramensis TaxID=2913411 RepID=UPI001EDB85CF|nr:RNA polymerase sigma factor [Sandaracinobacteroides sayramensis]